MKKSAFALLAASVVGLPALAAESFTIDSRHTYPLFEINHLGFSTQRGRFNKAEGKITLDRAAKTGAVELTIATASIDMGLDKWDEHMRSDEFFHVEKFPTMSFKSTKMNFEGDKPVAVEGNLTLLGVTKPLSLKVSSFNCGVHPINKKELCGADVSGSLKRSEFGMTKYLPGVSDEVRLIIPVEAFKD